MQYEVKRTRALRGLITFRDEPIWEAKVTSHDGTLWFSRYDDEAYWVLDGHFTESGFPVMNNGLGSRCTNYRVIRSDDPVAIALDALVAEQEAGEA